MTFNAQQLYEIGRVFDPGPDPALYHPSAAGELLRRRLHASLSTGPSLLVLSGESGAGKTLLTRVILQELPRSWVHVAQLSFSAMAGDDLLRAIAHAFRVPAFGGGDEDLSPLARLQSCLESRYRSGEGSLLIIDDAQALKADALRALHRLSRLRLDDQALLTVLLVGSPGLLMRLDSADVGPLADDFRPRFVMDGLELRESIAYIKDRLLRCQSSDLPAFTPAGLVEVHCWTAGVPGRINLLCRELLHQALLEQEDEDVAPIAPERVAAKAQEFGFLRQREPMAAPRAAAAVQAPAPAKPVIELWPSLAVAAFAGLAGMGLVFNQPEPLAVSAPPSHQARQIHEVYETAAPAPTSPSPPQVPVARPPAVDPEPVRSRPAAAPRTELAVASPERMPRDCTGLMTQLSLGEPLTPKQTQTLEATCR